MKTPRWYGPGCRGFQLGACAASTIWLIMGNFCFIGDNLQLPKTENEQTVSVKVAAERVDVNGEDSLRIWAFVHDSNRMAPVILLNLRTWRHHNPNMDIVIVNDTTVRNYIPDLPDEFFRLYPAAKSDAFRAAIIYYYGGFYADLDILVMESLSSMVDLLQTHDIVSYTSTDDPKCQDHFSSNFHGGKRGNPFSAVWWDNIKEKITRVCDVGEMAENKVCCHAKDQLNPRECHIPWGHLEHLKIPSQDHDLSPKSQLVNVTSSTRACLSGKQAFDVSLVDIGPELFWRPWPYSYNGVQCKRVGDNMHCTGTKQRTVENFFGRKAYHLFFTGCSDKMMSKEELLGGDLLLSHMYRQSLGIPDPDLKYEQQHLDQANVCK